MEVSLSKGAIHDMLFKVNYFAADQGKSLICSIFIEA